MSKINMNKSIFVKKIKNITIPAESSILTTESDLNTLSTLQFLMYLGLIKVKINTVINPFYIIPSLDGFLNNLDNIKHIIKKLYDQSEQVFLNFKHTFLKNLEC